MNRETLRAVLRRVLLAGVFAFATGAAATAPAAAEPGENPCELALSFVCRFVPIAPDLDHDVDLYTTVVAGWSRHPTVGPAAATDESMFRGLHLAGVRDSRVYCKRRTGALK
jgi:hypothetical protein